MIDLNITLLIQLVNFLIALIGINYILVKPIRNSIYQRQQTFFLKIEHINELTHQVNKSLLQYEFSITKTKEEAISYYKHEQETSEKLKNAMLDEAHDKTQKQIKKIHISMLTEAQNTKQLLQKETTTFAYDVVTTLLKNV